MAKTSESRHFLFQRNFLILLMLVAMSIQAAAQTSAPKTLSQKNSPCVIRVHAGEYSSYTVMKGEKELFTPRSDGIVKALFSPSGKYVAFGAGESQLIDVESGKFDFGVVVVNCISGAIIGYRKGLPTNLTKWDHDKGLIFVDFLTL
jgi:hypothetical protein